MDRKNESILLPIYGFAVPFHISTLKNISKSDEGEFVYLRFNFSTPGQSSGKKESGTVRNFIFFVFIFLEPLDAQSESPIFFVLALTLYQPYDDANATFIRAMSFRSSDTYRFTEIFKEVNELKKALTKREETRREMADLVEQDKLIEIRGRRPLRLPELFARPVLEGKRLPGDLEIHGNGLRYQSQMKTDQKIGEVKFTLEEYLFFSFLSPFV